MTRNGVRGFPQERFILHLEAKLCFIAEDDLEQVKDPAIKRCLFGASG